MSPSPLVPTLGRERYELLDVLRGLALVGIVLANMVSHSLYLYVTPATRAALPTATTDKTFDLLELTFIEAKFYTIFSILFGIGFSILMTRTEAKGLVFRRFFLRRAFFLFLIGVLHAVLFWHNDILAAYALCGALLLPFVRAPNRVVLGASIVALLMPLVLKLFGPLPLGTFTGPRDLLLAHFGWSMDARAQIWAGGNFSDIVPLNLSQWFTQIDFLITSGMLLKIYGCFLLGLYLGRNDLHERLEEHRTTLGRIAVAGFAVGLPLNVAYAATFESESRLHEAIAAVAIVPMSAAYMAVVALTWTRARGGRLGTYFAAVGRMALTNYVGQSVICMIIFRGVGLGLGMQVGPTLYLPIGLAIYILQVITSRLWLARFQFGPLEWLWRVLTYGSAVPLRKGTLAQEGPSASR